MAKRAFNFSAGPAAMPTEVLERIKGELLDYRGLGMSIMEMSHRSKTFEEVSERAAARFHKLTGLNDDFAVLFLHGGATQQFSLIPMNFYKSGHPVDMVHSGHWTERAMKEMKPLAEVRVIASSEAKKFREIPKVAASDISDQASYLHYCSNNTIFGTQCRQFVFNKKVPTVIDMSSDILSRSFSYSDFDLIFAGAQKNLGPSGLCVVAIRKSWAEKGREDLSPFFQYRNQIQAKSLYNTANTFAIYMTDLVLEWIENQGGVAGLEKINQTKAEILYSHLDESSFFSCPVKKEDRSLMNVVFELQSPNPDLEKKFVSEAEAAGLIGLKGHRIAGGFRASLYNAVSKEAVVRLVEFMKEFSQKSK